ncbi:hypothetical protein ACVWXQ_002906 [Bradyrhizobium sp. S3.14.4]
MPVEVMCGPRQRSEPVALVVDLDRLGAGNGVDQLDLEGLALVAEHLLGLLAIPDFLGEGFVARDDLAHLLLDRGKVFRRERLVAEEVVVEAVLDHGTDGDLGARPQRLHGFGEHVGAVVADQLERARIVAVDQLDLGIGFDGIVEVGDYAVERHRNRALGQRRRNALGDLEAGDALGVFAPGAVGEGEGDLFGRGHGSQIAEAVLKAGFGFGLVGHAFLLRLTPANERR